MGNQSSALHQAAAHNDVQEVESLIIHRDGNVNDRDKDGWTPLHFAAYGGALEVTQFLLVKGANAEPKDTANRTPLHLAALQGHSILASLLIGRGASVDAKDENNMTPLHKASIKGNTEVGEQLLRLGADPNGEVKDGTTALQLAAWKDQVGFVRLLISMGARVQTAANNGRTALHEAAEAGNNDIVQLLLSNGARAQARDNEGHTAADLASKSGHNDVADLLAKVAGHTGQGAGPSAPPYQPGKETSGPVRYPDVYKPSEEAVEKQTNKDFWSQQLGEPDKEKGRNQGFWGDALGGAASQSQPVKKDSPYQEAAKESARNKEFWDKKLASGDFKIPQRSQDWDARAGQAASAWQAQMDREVRQQQDPQQEHPRKQFEQNLLQQAQGFWNMLQGKPGHDEHKGETEEERRRREAQETDDEWGGRRPGSRSHQGNEPSDAPRTEKYDLEPYDDDDYEPSSVVRSSGKAGGRGSKDSAALQRKLAQLELDVDRDQGWIRGGSKTDADEAALRRNRIKGQEAEIAALKKQLAGQNKGPFGGRTGGKATHGVPAEYLCPITQEIMHDPVTAGDGYTYERGAIEKWLGSHNTSPMTGGRMPQASLQANHSLKSAIRQWQS